MDSYMIMDIYIYIHMIYDDIWINLVNNMDL